MNNKGFVYWIHKKEDKDITTQGYVGVTNDIKRRWGSHKTSRKCLHLHNAIEKYGADNLIWEVVFTGIYSDCLQKENDLRPSLGIGWNINIGGGNKLANLGKKLTEEHKASISKGNKGKTCSEETKIKIAKAHLGRQHTAETKRKMKEAKLGVQLKGSHKDSIAKSMKGKQHGIPNLKPGSTKAVICLELNKLYNSSKEASLALNINHSNITQVCKGRRKTAGGYTWKYK